MIIGGSLGSKIINDALRESIDDLLDKFNIIHICGKNNLDEKLEGKNGYKQFEYVSEELPHLMNAADLVISRAGANAIFELLALKKPNLLIPLSKRSSRGDQILNAASFEKNGYSMILQEEDLSSLTLVKKISDLFESKDKYIKAMNSSPVKDGVLNIIELIKKYSTK